MKKLRVRDKLTYLEVVDPYYETICESFLDKSTYAEKAKVTVNEMVHAWNCSFGKGLDILTGISPHINLTPRTKQTFIATWPGV